MLKKFLLLTTFALLLAACLPSAPQPVDVQSQVNTAVAQTMEANSRIAESVALTVAAHQPLNSPTPEASATFEIVPIFTDTPLPTFTPFPTNTSAPAPVNVQVPYSCFVTTVRPDYLEVIKAGSNFEIRWIVKNTGTNTWDSGVDVKFAGGTNFTDRERVEINKTMAPGDTFKISITGKAGKKTGVQQMSWIVENARCFANVAITVK